MDVKIDTKEKFTVITPNEPELSANMTAQLIEMLLPYLFAETPHIVLNMKYINNMEDAAYDKIAAIQHQFYDKNASFIVCELQKAIEKQFAAKDLLDMMNVTPSESEAWDIAQMEEIERELMKDFENNTEA